MPFMLTRTNVGDYDTWKAVFDQDEPGVRRDATRRATETCAASRTPAR